MTAPRPEGVTPGDIAGLRDSTNSLAEAITKMATREELAAETVALTEGISRKEDKSRVNNLATAVKLGLIVAVVIAVMGVWIGWRGKEAADSAQRSLNTFQVNRTEARRVACADDNRFIESHNTLVTAAIEERQAIIAATQASQTQSEEQKARSIAFFVDQIARYQNSLVPLRDCSSDAAIDAYYSKKTSG